MRKVFFILLTFFMTCSNVFAQNNYLHTIRLEKNNTGYNIILGTDEMTKVTKNSPSDKELEVVLNGITSSDKIDAVYRGANDIDSLVVENMSKNRVKVLISAPNIKNSTIILEPANGQSTIVGETIPLEKTIWIAFVLALSCIIFKSAKKRTKNENLILQKDIKDREIEIYRKYRKEFSSVGIINPKRDMKMKKIMKKIDRKIDERLASANN